VALSSVRLLLTYHLPHWWSASTTIKPSCKLVEDGTHQVHHRRVELHRLVHEGFVA